MRDFIRLCCKSTQGFLFPNAGVGKTECQGEGAKHFETLGLWGWTCDCSVSCLQRVEKRNRLCFSDMCITFLNLERVRSPFLLSLLLVSSVFLMVSGRMNSHA
ncbi:hypothetical protein ASPVEDRAFT_862608 [Aspergillus versicolor CBS 583.65]|uniref:Uncharacterized protein n=1 Tax=Aspergillus versicolor CBS 583.65 TaxID=1036611 RepID=A0A1L9PW24_ASPVE|nr:uncharacterized protein ASPVEDRAFT_862608 [Aspergillus versicolor CBS 583.65]OJJ05642.1 hypothetical protein ASPVEDRAFT_862608 [Aspergillus versicolor CBS 583.65]